MPNHLHLVLNLDKREKLDPNGFGEVAHVKEFGPNSSGTMTGLAILCSDGNGRGGGDFHGEDQENAHLIGSWAGDRISIVPDSSPEYGEADKEFKDITEDLVVLVIRGDKYTADDIIPRLKNSGTTAIEDRILKRIGEES